ncbi:hypothetical protein [Oceanobacter sp. 4_MG-2023]|uniref:hypothetical protein n=1 Tax=Oceanobacter sp. 4_MG-2023 TaxID=3062623 RepID=UPI0027326755|nr:hypothetical protein [Oceanobacter sp. 4_MG-2023]MDP2548870.1 hypothetical protein [Oceanobacter sp. 4_MG-2023]
MSDHKELNLNKENLNALTAETLRQSAEKIQNYFFKRMTSPNVVDISKAISG